MTRTALSRTGHWFQPPAKKAASTATGLRKVTPRAFSSLQNRKRGALVLNDGQSFEGWHFGADKQQQGHLVFSTNMTGYPESMTDPSYCGQVRTTPRIRTRRITCPLSPQLQFALNAPARASAPPTNKYTP